MKRRKLCVLGLSAVPAVLLVVVFHGTWTTTVIPSKSAQKLLTDSNRVRSEPKSIKSYDDHERFTAHHHQAESTQMPHSKDCADEHFKRECCQNRTIRSVDQESLYGELPSGQAPKQVGHTGGYMLSFRYYEQQTQGTRNLLQMQCLADSFGMRIVEPFVIGSMFSIPISVVHSTENISQKYLSLGDLVDIKGWNMEAHKKFGYSSIASWDEFLLNAPRKVIAHCIRYRNPPKIQVPIPGFNYRQGCPKQCYDKFSKSIEYLSAFGFYLVQKTCSNFVDYAGSVPTERFIENVMGKYSSGEVTVLVNEFRGLFGLYRLPVLSECGIIHNRIDVSTMPSSRIRADARKYSTDVFNGRPYAAVIARIERVILHLHQNVSECSQEIAGILKDLKSSHKISDSFLAMDVGTFGSSGSARNNFKPYGEVLFNSIYGNQWSFSDWEASFESLASSDNPAYVANLQRTIAASSRCLILFGGGGFQGQARNLYERFHPDPKSQCIYKVCSREV